MKHILEQGTGMVLCAILPAAGFILRMVLYGYYTGLEGACQKIRETENKTIHNLRAEIRRRKKNKAEDGTERGYTDFYLSACRFAGVPLQTLERISKGTAWMSLPVCGLVSCACFYFGCELLQGLGVLFFGTALVTALGILDLFFGIEEKKQRIRFYFGDYARELAEAGEEVKEKPFERVLAFPLVTEKSGQEADGEEETVPKKEGKRSSAAKKSETAAKAESTGRSRKEGRAQEEKRKLAEELLKERRQMGSRRYEEDSAAAREPEETAEKKAGKEEYAVSEADTERFEKMFRGMLMEMLDRTEKKKTPAEE